ncbi:PT domain-containing protein [Halorarum halobium]|uniref:PT domain-containing protein n=1 Tax=Halorarum halobium TaxID=3075121 RepID=UPI0028AF6936|nr:PT domain-containing protein [Halobaculum sp. XH14]
MYPFDMSRREFLGAAAIGGASVGIGDEPLRERAATTAARRPRGEWLQVGEDALLEIVTAAEGALFYEFTVEGTVSKAFGGDAAAELRNDDLDERRSGLVAVAGESGNGEGDAYRLSGSVVDFEYNDGAAPAFEVLLDGRDVTDRVTSFDTPDAELGRDLFEVRTGGGGTLEYEVVADGRITKAFDRGGNSAEVEDDVDRFRDGAWGVLGATGDGDGDAFYLYGPIIEFEHKADGAPPFTLLLNGRDVTDRLLAGERVGDDGGTGEDGTDADETDSEQDEEETARQLDAWIDPSCYYATVEAESYDEVRLEMSDGSVPTFSGDYAGERVFGFAGSGQTDEDAETFGAYHGWIREVVVLDGDARASATHDRRGCVDVEFGCEAATLSHPTDVNVDVNAYFADGTTKGYDGGFGNELRVVSPGRVLDRLSFDTPNEVVVRNPNSPCGPGEHATRFSDDCTEVTVGAAEFGSLPRTFQFADLAFADGSERRVGERGGDPAYAAPVTFAGTGENEGKAIENVRISADGGDVSFNVVNAADCVATAGTPTEEPTDSPTTGATDTPEATPTDAPSGTPTDGPE